jgi:hypothetical protein
MAYFVFFKQEQVSTMKLLLDWKDVKEDKQKPIQYLQSYLHSVNVEWLNFFPQRRTSPKCKGMS